MPELRHTSAMPGPVRRALCVATALALLHGCASPRGAADDAASPQQAQSAPLSFEVDVVSDNRQVADHLRRHLDIQRFTGFPDLQPGELRRLLAEAETDARDLLAALGYFRPQLQLRAGEARDGEPRRVVIEVEPGEAARVTGHHIRFAEPMNADPAGEAQRRAIEERWVLKPGATFTQEGWDAAKSGGLRILQRERYPAARIADSRAVVHADTGEVELHVTYDAGASYRFGRLELQGLERYDGAGIGNIARLPVGADYSEEQLLDAQQRLIGSGYFDAAFLLLDTEGSDPEHATVIAQLREARYQKLVFGLGYSTDAGPRVSIDHTHNNMWPLRWRALNQVAVGTQTQSLSTQSTAMPRASGWAWYTGLALERSDYGDFKANSVSLTGGRMRSGERSERRYYVQYDASKAEGGSAPGGSSSMLANYAWTGRYFDNRANPGQGLGLGAEAGLGFTLTPRRDPFVRVHLRALHMWPFGGGNASGRRHRLALRAETGAIEADDGVNIPVPLLFLTGGDTTVRGYSYHSIGTRLADGSIYGGRYMALGSVEWLRPVTLFGDAASWEHAIFVDSGTATDSVRRAELYTGVGTGMRWTSPVGPLQLDAAYGTRGGGWRLHLRMGFQF